MSGFVDEMFCCLDIRPIMTAILAVLLLIAVPSVTSYQGCSSALGDRCIQKCNTTSCECNGRAGQHVYQGCTQMCGRYRCRNIICSSGNCIQSCHGCTMECTSDVGFCVQRCLSGKCEFKCSARHCEQVCNVGDCKLTRNKHTTSAIPRRYLLLLAGCFATTTILSFIALCISCRAMKKRRKNTYQRLRSIPGTPPTAHATRHGQFHAEDSITPISVLPLQEKPI